MQAAGVFFIALLTSMVTAGATVYGVERYDVFRFHQEEPKVAVPGLVGLAEQDARANLKAVGLVYLAAPRQITSAVPPGHVVQQSVVQGERVPRDQPVSVTVAAELPKVPAVTGLTLADATARLTGAGFQVGKTESVPGTSEDQDKVVAQEPAANAPLVANSPVLLRVSLGPGEVEMPKLLGRGVTQAQTDLEKLGLKVQTRWMSVAETSTFVVLSQKPAPGSKLKPGSDVELVANR